MRMVLAARVLTALAITVVTALAAPVRAANPYAPAFTVNSSVVTEYDIDQRMKLLDALGANGDLRKTAIQQLTEDRVKLQAAKAIGITLPEGAIQSGIEEFATNRGLTADDVTEVLQVRGIDQQTMNDFVQSGLMWREVLGSRFRARAMPTDADLDQAMALQAKRPREMLYMAEIALPFAERSEAETVTLANQIYAQVSRGASFADLAQQYSRSGTAEQGGALPPVSASQLPSDFRSQVLLLRPGQTTRPMPISGGLALIKLLSIKQEPPDAKAVDTPEARDQLRKQLFSERIANFGQGYLQELLGDALIVQK
ncbi:MAG: peptidylprolyl isomerase [Amaricoccus sp.]|uniref:peptidylprolyl isomerase n=1 Tax=Amaricoccus sp. TaxID=1872485 RepID=UPI0039E434D0